VALIQSEPGKVGKALVRRGARKCWSSGFSLRRVAVMDSWDHSQMATPTGEMGCCSPQERRLKPVLQQRRALEIPVRGAYHQASLNPRFLY
jgi:hypothetical protein